MFGKRNLKSTNETTFPPPQSSPRSTTINNQPVNYAAIILVAVIAIILFVFFAWHALVFLADQAGSHYPEREVAKVLLTSLGGIIILLIIGLLANCVLGNILGQLFDFKKEMAQKELEKEIARSQTAQLLPPQVEARALNEDKRRAMAILNAMHKGFERIDERGKLPGKVQPWARRQVGAFVLYGEREPIGEHTSLASFVKTYLLDKRILLDERTINLQQFPDLVAVRMQVERDFGEPIIIHQGAPSALRDNRGFEFVEG